MTPWIKKYKLSKQEVAKILEDVLEGTGARWDWDDFTQGMTLEDPYLDQIGSRCSNLSEEFPPERPNECCNERGRKRHPGIHPTTEKSRVVEFVRRWRDAAVLREKKKGETEVPRRYYTLLWSEAAGHKEMLCRNQ
jgi:hypothetical protein